MNKTLLGIAATVLLIIVVVFLWKKREASSMPNNGNNQGAPSFIETGNGVSHYDSSRAYDGYNLVNGCNIYDMRGNFIKSYPGVLCTYFSSGEVVVGEWDRLQLYKSDLNLVWEKKIPVHHELLTPSDSSILFISSEERLYEGDSLVFAVIYDVSREGDVLWRWSTYDHLSELKQIIDNYYGPTYTDTLHRKFEYFHFNSLQALPDNIYAKVDSAFKPGNILVSDLGYRFLFIVDPVSNKIVWTYFQPIPCRGQHAARMVENSNIIMFVNQFLLGGEGYHPYSKLVEINPVTKQIVWEYVDNPPEYFYCEYQGHVQRLPNGNTLVTVDDAERPDEDNDYPNQFAFEFTPDDDLVWKWIPTSADSLLKNLPEGFYHVERVSKEKMAPFVKDAL